MSRRYKPCRKKKEYTILTDSGEPTLWKGLTGEPKEAEEKIDRVLWSPMKWILIIFLGFLIYFICGALYKILTLY